MLSTQLSAKFSATINILSKKCCSNCKKLIFHIPYSHTDTILINEFFFQLSFQILFIEADLARILRDTGDIQLSAATMLNAITKYREAADAGYTKLHPKYASMLAIYGLILRDIGEHSEAKKFLWNALELQKQVLGSHNLMKVETLCNLGTVQHRLQQTDKALESLKAALDMMNHLGDNISHSHPLRSTVLVASGRLLLDMGKIEDGWAQFNQGATIRIKTCGELHPNVALYYELRGSTELKGTARDHTSSLKDALQIYSSLMRRENSLSAEYNVNLPVLEEWKKKINSLESL